LPTLVVFRCNSRSPLDDRPDRTWRKPAAAIGADIEQHLLDALGAERALVRTNSGIDRVAAETGMTPAKAIERLRLEAAREQVESGAEPIEAVAAYTGFGDPERMRRAFIRAFGQPPQALRRSVKIALF
jgi:transcriptional regulator GlxA family with amidase domain